MSRWRLGAANTDIWSYFARLYCKGEIKPAYAVPVLCFAPINLLLRFFLLQRYLTHLLCGEILVVYMK